MECVMLFLIGLIPPFIAIEHPKTKVKDFILWWIFGTLLFFIALPLAIYKQVQKQKKAAWLATRWKRFWGATIDSLLQLVLLMLFLWATGILQKMIEMRDITYREQVTINSLNLLTFTLLNGFLLYSKGQTIGKYIVGITIVDMERKKANIWRSLFLRYYLIMLIGFIPEIGTFIGWLDDLLIFRADYRCIHDHLAGTQVVEKSWAQPEPSQS